MHQGQGKCTFPPGAFNCISYKVLGMQQQLKARVISIGTDKRSLHRNSAAFRLGGSLRCIHLEGFLHHLLLLLRFRLNFFFVGRKRIAWLWYFLVRVFPVVLVQWEKMKPVIGLVAISLNWWKCIKGVAFCFDLAGLGIAVQQKAVTIVSFTSSFCIMTKEKVFW